MEIGKFKPGFLKRENLITSPKPPVKIGDKEGKIEQDIEKESSKKDEGGEKTNREVINEEGEKRALIKEDGKGEIVDIINEGMTTEDDEKGKIINEKV
jgi:hypothetical protein